MVEHYAAGEGQGEDAPKVGLLQNSCLPSALFYCAYHVFVCTICSVHVDLPLEAHIMSYVYHMSRVQHVLVFCYAIPQPMRPWHSPCQRTPLGCNLVSALLVHVVLRTRMGHA